jgi:hypothetical protein
MSGINYRPRLFYIAVCIVSAVFSLNAATPDSSNFRLNYSTAGYDSRGTKQALVRTITAIATAEVSTADSRWELIDSATGTTSASGVLSYFGTTYGIQFWTVDFTSFRGEGRFYLLVTLKQNAGTAIGTRRSLTFPVQANNFSKTMLMDLALNNADLRQINDYQGGFCDATSTGFREAYSHGIFLYGFLEMYKAKYNSLSSTDKTRLITNINIAFDHIVSYWAPDGVTLLRHPEGPPRGGMNDIEPYFGMAMYMALFKGKDAKRASDGNFTKLVACYNNLDTASAGWQDTGYQEYRDYLIACLVYMYLYSGDETWKNLAITRLNTFLSTFNLRTHYRGSARGIPLFEGLRVCAEQCPGDPNYAAWISQARAIKDAYYKSAQVLTGNAFHIVNTCAAANPSSDWDNSRMTGDMWGSLMKGYTGGPYARDALVLANLTGDGTLEKVAAGEIYWDMGLNPGVPAASIINPPATDDRESAAFIVNGKFRHVVRVAYYCPNLSPGQTAPYLTIVNGFNSNGGADEFNYEGTVSYNGELFIKHDGCEIIGALAYEDYLTKQESASIVRKVENPGVLNDRISLDIQSTPRTTIVRYTPNLRPGNSGLKSGAIPTLSITSLSGRLRSCSRLPGVRTTGTWSWSIYRLSAGGYTAAVSFGKATIVKQFVVLR